MPLQDGMALMEDVRIIFRNFEGRPGRFNKEGDRNFAVLLDDDIANVMLADDWNIKWLNPREDDDGEATRQAYLPVAVGYKTRPPRIVMITSRGRTNLDEDSIKILDLVDIKTVDLIVKPSSWSVNGKSGIKAYVKSLYVTVDEDPLDIKYNGLDEQYQDPTS